MDLNLNTPVTIPDHSPHVTIQMNKLSREFKDSVEYLKDGLTTDKMKKECVEALHCDGRGNKLKPVKGLRPSKGIYSTETSHWVRSKGVASKVYRLLGVKLWHLKDNNLIFDPLRKCKMESDLTADNSIWCHIETLEEKSKLSVDCMLSSTLSSKQFAALRKLDIMLETLDKANEIKTNLETERFFEELDNKTSCSDEYSMQFDELIDTVSHIILRNVNGERVPQKMFEELFQMLVQCLILCLAGDRKRHVRIKNDVSGQTLEKIPVSIKLEKGQMHMEISSQPDLFMYFKKQRLVGELRTVLAVVEVKGTHQSQIFHSDDEGEETAPGSDFESGVMRRPSLPTIEDEDDDANDEDSDEDPDDETDLEKLMTEKPEWLGSLRDLRYGAKKTIKKFLPQLIGEMWCAARSKNMERIKSHNGLLFGIGVVGFEIYFVSMLDPIQDNSEYVINVDTPNVNVFVTRPLNLLDKDDRRVIMKTLTASFSLHRAWLCES